MSDVIVQTVRATEVVSVPKYILTLGQEEAECLLALIYCQLSDPERSPLVELRNQLDIMVTHWEGARGNIDMREVLADRYAQFVKG